MKLTKTILLVAAGLLTGIPSKRLAAQDADVIIDLGQGTVAQMISPANGALLSSPTVTFQWSEGLWTEAYWFFLGTTPGGNDLVNQSVGLNTSLTVNQLPLNGNPVYATLWSYYFGDWYYLSYSYSTAGSAAPSAAPARMISPVDSSTLPAGSVVFQWTSEAQARQYWLWIGSSRDGYDLLNQDGGTSTTWTVSNLPQDGRPVYVKLWTWVGNEWLANSYQYTASSSTGNGTGGGTGTGTTSSGDRILRFDGVDDLALIPVDASETSYTMSIWFRTTTPNGGLFSACLESGSDNDRNIYLRDGNLCARLWAEQTISTENRNFADGNWHLVTHVFGGNVGGQKLFVDGQLLATGTLAASAFYWQTHVVVGFSWVAPKGFFTGDIYNVLLMDRALSAEEVAAQVSQGLSFEDPNLVGYWGFDEEPASNELFNSAPRNSTLKGILGRTAQAGADDPQRVLYR